MPENSAAAIRKFLEDPRKPIDSAEFREFWLGLSAKEKNEYKKAVLG